MGFKRILIVLLILLLLGAGVIWSYKYYLLNKTSHLLEHVPAEANTVIYLNTRALFMQMKDTDSLPLNKQFWKKSKYLQHVKSLQETGLDLLSDMALVHYQGFYYYQMLLKDSAVFETQIRNAEKGLFHDIVDRKSFKTVFSSKDSFQIMWTDKTVVFIPKTEVSKCLLRVEDFLFVKSEKSFKENPICKQVQNDTVPIWFYSKNKLLQNYSITQLKGYILYGDTLQILASEDLSAEVKPINFKIDISDSVNYLYSDSVCKPLNEYIRNLSVLYLGSESDEVVGIDFNRVLKAFVLSGTTIKERTSISYAYDDNFNSVKTEVVKKDTIQTALLQYQYMNTGSTISLSNSNDTGINNFTAFKSNNIQSYLSFNQDLFKGLIPEKMRFKVLGISKKESNAVSIHIKVKIPSINNIIL